MKRTMKLLALFIGVLLLANIANAESPREQLKRMVEQLQASPTDNALREKIIKLAQGLKPAPVIPEEAIRFVGRGMFVFKSAASDSDYLDAAREYEKAIPITPWMVGYYSDLCVIYEKARKYQEAKRNCEFALLGTLDQSQLIDLKQRIAGLEIGIERNSPQMLEMKKREADERLVRSLNGVRYSCGESSDEKGNRFEYRIRVNDGKLIAENVTIFSTSEMATLARYGQHPDNPQIISSPPMALGGDEPRKYCARMDGAMAQAWGGAGSFCHEISEDGNRVKGWMAYDSGKFFTKHDCIRR